MVISLYSSWFYADFMYKTLNAVTYFFHFTDSPAVPTNAPEVGLVESRMREMSLT